MTTIACPRKETSDNFSRLSEIKRIEERSIWFVIIKSSFIASYIIGRKWDGRNIELSRTALTYNEIYLALCSVPKPLRNKFFYDKVTEHALPHILSFDTCYIRKVYSFSNDRLVSRRVFFITREKSFRRIIDKCCPSESIDRSQREGEGCKVRRNQCRSPISLGGRDLRERFEG